MTVRLLILAVFGLALATTFGPPTAWAGPIPRGCSVVQVGDREQSRLDEINNQGLGRVIEGEQIVATCEGVSVRPNVTDTMHTTLIPNPAGTAKLWTVQIHGGNVVGDYNEQEISLEGGPGGEVYNITVTGIPPDTRVLSERTKEILDEPRELDVLLRKAPDESELEPNFFTLNVSKDWRDAENALMGLQADVEKWVRRGSDAYQKFNDGIADAEAQKNAGRPKLTISYEKMIRGALEIYTADQVKMRGLQNSIGTRNGWIVALSIFFVIFLIATVVLGVLRLRGGGAS